MIYFIVFMLFIGFMFIAEHVTDLLFQPSNIYTAAYVKNQTKSVIALRSRAEQAQIHRKKTKVFKKINKCASNGYFTCRIPLKDISPYEDEIISDFEALGYQISEDFSTLYVSWE